MDAGIPIVMWREWANFPWLH